MPSSTAGGPFVLIVLAVPPPVAGDDHTDLASRNVIILNNGRIVYDGTAANARDQPELLHANLGVF